MGDPPERGSWVRVHPDDAEHIDLDDRYLNHAAAHHVSAAELHEVWLNVEKWVRNKRMRTADWMMIGRTNGGRPIVAYVVVEEARSAISPITARACTAEEESKWLP